MDLVTAMANRDCHGDFYEVDGSRWYRCLWDSAVMPAAECEGGTCPNCERKIHATEQGKVQTRQFLVTEAYYDGRWYGHTTVEHSSADGKS